MRIGIDVRLWNETGVGRYIRNLVKELAVIDIRNEYFLFALKKDVEEIEKATISRRHRWRVIPVKSHWHSFSEQTDFVRLLYKYPLDLMHFPYFSLPVLYRKPFVVTIHDLIIHHFATGKASTLSLPMYQTKRFFFKQVLRYGLNESQKVIVPLECVKEDIIKTFRIPGEKIAVTKEGYDSSIQNSKLKIQDSGSPYFLYVGNAYPHKNLENLIKGFLLFKDEAKNTVKLYLVGKKDYFYVKLEKEYKHIDDILFMHDVSDQDLAKLYTNASALVSASVMEGFGLPPLEAMANGCVPLISDIPSFKEVCGEGAVYFDQTDCKKIGEAMLEWMKVSKTEKDKRIENGKKRVKLFSWKQMAETTKEIYEGSISLRSS
jgi:glycosyltransferase involved in cell wall biosynthesis